MVYKGDKTVKAIVITIALLLASGCGSESGNPTTEVNNEAIVIQSEAGIWDGTIGNQYATFIIDDNENVYGSSKDSSTAIRKYYTYSGNISDANIKVQRRDNDFYFSTNSPSYFAFHLSSVPISLDSIYQQEITGHINDEDTMLLYSISGSDTDIVGDWWVYYHRLEADQYTDRYIIDVSIDENGVITGNYTGYDQRITPLSGDIIETQLGNHTVLDANLTFHYDNSAVSYSGYAIQTGYVSTSVNGTTNYRSMLFMIKQDDDDSNNMTFTLTSNITVN